MKDSDTLKTIIFSFTISALSLLTITLGAYTISSIVDQATINRNNK